MHMLVIRRAGSVDSGKNLSSLRYVKNELDQIRRRLVPYCTGNVRKLYCQRVLKRVGYNYLYFKVPGSAPPPWA